MRYNQLNDPDPSNYNSTGHGYARGMEIFFRDRKTIKNGDYWISYSYLDTRKLYQDFTSERTPSLFAKHALNFVGKYYFNPLRTQFGLTYQYSSGRPYYPPQDADIAGGYTIGYHNISANLSYLTRLFNYFTIIHFSVSNVFGIHQVYGYHFVQNAQNSGYTVIPVEPASKRFYVLALFVTLDKNYVQY